MGTLLDLLGLKRTGGNYQNIRGYINHHQLDNSHWTGMLWSKGKTAATDPRIAAQAKKITTPDEKVFVIDSTYASGRLLKRLLRRGWENKCKICGLLEWQGKPIRLHVDHINGHHYDHRLTNLRILCPNCHQQTETWGNKNY